MKPFDLTPDPRVLIALTHTPLKPLDALSELIDNSIDSIAYARNAGKPIEHPIVIIELPTGQEVSRGEGVLRVRDNGIGMSAEVAENALKAGYSGNNPYDSLGLFGMGFNIATGKLGNQTTLITALKEDSFAIKAVINLRKILDSGCYEVVPEQISKPQGFEHGSLVEVTGWWPDGNQNSGFIRKLVGYGRARIRQEIGRRYSSLILHQKVRIIVDGEPCNPFEHCIWGDNRSVDRRNHGKISAVQRFSHSVGSQTRCAKCYAQIPTGNTSCSVCDSSSLRTIDEKVHGWVGIQRYDDLSHFGIDLIRNGRIIRLLEKTAFFDFVDEFGNLLKEYPIDGPYGRIVGEVHLDHVPVDFMKQDFQRTSPEWIRSISYLRGDSSLLPSNPGADTNTSPVFMLFQGYRRVRRCGTSDMYMGIWDDQAEAPKRIDRSVEKEYLTKFNQHLPGFYDDTEWWKLVEGADSKPIEELVECPGCGAENMQSSEICQVCDAILISKKCVKCAESIALSAVNCAHCGESQIPQVEEPWGCQVCATNNHAAAIKCIACDSVRGTPNPLSASYLKENSDRDERLSIAGCSVKLADGSYSQAVDVECFNCHKQIVSIVHNERMPLLVSKAETIEIFIDNQHAVFKALGIKPESLISSEIAQYIHVLNSRLSGSVYKLAHSVSNIQWELMNKYWANDLSDSVDKVKDDVIAYISDLSQRLSVVLADSSSDIFDELTDDDKRMLLDNIIEAGLDISTIGSMKQSGVFLKYVSPLTIVRVFKKYTSKFFDGNVWSQAYATIPDIPDHVMDEYREQIKSTYLNCLDDCASFASSQRTDMILVQRTRASLQYLQRKFEY